MVAIVESDLRESVLGQLKFIEIQTSAAAATGHTIDLNSDVADGKGMRMEVIRHVIVNDDAGLAVTDSSFDPATGIITMGTLSTGIHNVLIIGY